MRNRVKELRMKALMSQADLAKQLKIAQPVLSRIEGNRNNPSLELALKIAQVLNANVEDIFLPEVATQMLPVAG